MISKIQDRIILILDEWAGVMEGPIERGKWRNLEEKTGVSAQKWKHVYGGNQKPTPEIIEAIARYWPQYAFWMVTGVTDSINGHIAPPTALTFPECQQPGFQLSGSSREYFSRSIELIDNLYNFGRVDLSNDEIRLGSIKRAVNFFQREAPPDEFHETSYSYIDCEYGDASLSKVVPELTKTNMYRELIDSWKSRYDLIKNSSSEGLFYAEDATDSASKL